MLDDKLLGDGWKETEKRYARQSVSALLTELVADIAMRWVMPAKDTERETLLIQHEDLRNEMARLYHALQLIRDRVDDGKLD